MFPSEITAFFSAPCQMACHEFHQYRNIFSDWKEMVKSPGGGSLRLWQADFEKAVGNSSLHVPGMGTKCNCLI